MHEHVSWRDREETAHLQQVSPVQCFSFFMKLFDICPVRVVNQGKCPAVICAESSGNQSLTFIEVELETVLIESGLVFLKYLSCVPDLISCSGKNMDLSRS